MTHTETISARIARLEALAQALPDHYRQEKALVAELAVVRHQIQEGEAARRILPALSAQIESMLTGGAPGRPEEAPITPALIAAPDAETPAETLEPAARDLGNSESNPEDMRPARPERIVLRDLPPRPAPCSSRVSLHGQVMAFFKANPLGEFAADEVVKGLPKPAPAPLVHALMQEMHRSGTLSAGPVDADGQQWFCLPPPKVFARSPAGQTVCMLPPVPEHLDVDQRCLFDCLRREEDGLTQRLLTARLNWTSSRTQRALDALIKEGHIGRQGDLLRVIPEELRGKAGVA